VSGTFAPGGSGKSSNAMAEAVAMAGDRDLFGTRPVGPLCVLYANGEDPQDENLRKAAAVCRHYGITGDELGGRLHLLSGRDSNLILAKSGRDGVIINREAFAELRRVITEIRADVVVLDPIVGFHRLVENDNTAMGALCYALARLAEEANCAVELVAHTRKMGLRQTEIGVDDGRGASAVIAAMRSARVFNRMSAEEADKAGVHPGDRWRYSRIDNGKSNLAPPEKTVWRKMASVPLWNGPDGAAGDEVGVMTAWRWPDRAGQLTGDEIRAIQGVIAGRDWRSDIRAGDWAGYAVGEALGFDAREPSGKARAKEILSALTADGSLKAVNGTDRKGNNRPCIRVGNLNQLRKSNEIEDETGGEVAGEW
jgi:AAA domain